MGSFVADLCCLCLSAYVLETLAKVNPGKTLEFTLASVSKKYADRRRQVSSCVLNDSEPRS